jgi:hypothetical protein
MINLILYNIERNKEADDLQMMILKEFCKDYTEISSYLNQSDCNIFW